MGTTTQLLNVELGDQPEGLARVLTVLRRRQCRVLRVDYAAPDRHYAGRLVIAVAAPSAHAHCVRAWVENLVDVHAVTAMEPASAAAA
jgi:acetolactate synthase regulatory subunit